MLGQNVREPFPGTVIPVEEYQDFASSLAYAAAYEGRLIVCCRRPDQPGDICCVLFPSYNYGTGGCRRKLVAVAAHGWQGWCR